MRKIFVIFTFIAISFSLAAQDTVTIAFIGDVMQHKKQLQVARIKNNDTLLSSSYDYSSYFKYTGDIISGADYAVANMEFVCGLPPYTGYPSFSAPKSLAEEAVNSGIDLFLCANNHIFDKGQRGFEATLQTYSELNVSHTGVYRDREERDSLNPFITDIKGIKCAFINFTYGTNTAARKAIVNRMDSISVVKAIVKAKEKEADIIIALPHWGIEYSTLPSPQQKSWERFLYRNGVNVIIGGHPHVIQPIRQATSPDGEIEHITAYSLGNYISNMSAKNTQMGFIFILKLVKNGDDCRIVSGEPVWIWCARGGRFESNYTVLPVEEFIDKKDRFPIGYEYQNMVDTYTHLRDIINNYGK